MQLRKFYGRTLKAALAQVKNELGNDALILETLTLREGSAAARMNPGAKYEVLAVRDANGAHGIDETREEKKNAPQNLQARSNCSPLLRDLGLLRAQIRELLEPNSPEDQLRRSNLDLADYQSLIDLGVDHRTLAPVFREWLAWRTATTNVQAYLSASGRSSPISLMQGNSLREWLWHAWSMQQGSNPDAAASVSGMAMLGPTGSGKTTTLAKISSKKRHADRQNAVILTLDTHRFGATEQWRRFSKLLGIPVYEIVTQADLTSCRENITPGMWVGIDTPGGMTPDSAAGRIYGSLLAQMPFIQPVLILPASQQEADGKDQMRRAREYGVRRLMFTKLDETTRPGGLLNLTMNSDWKIDSLAAGRRVPQDLELATAQTLWNRVLAPRAEFLEGALA